MYYLIESQEQLKEFSSKDYKEAFIEVIPYHDAIHPALNQISLLYIKPIIQKSKGYIIAVNHSETLSIEIEEVELLLKSYDKLYVRDQKQLLYYFPLRQLIDISFGNSKQKVINTYTHEHFYQKYPTYPEINTIIPVSKVYEKYEGIYDSIKELCKVEQNPYYNKLSKAIFSVERNALTISRRLFDKYHETTEDRFSIVDNTIFTRYNLYTLTGRPSNSFNGINFSALPKDNKSRSAFIPQNDEFINIDISAYHPTLAARLVKHKFKNDIYDEFGSYAGISRDEAKKLMFQQIYGNIIEKYKEWPYFIKIQEYINKNWEQFNQQGFIEIPISGVRFYKKQLEEMNPNKLFNYVLQAYETAQNVDIIWDISRILRGAESKLILYSYDAFLIDFKKGDEKLLEDIYNIFKKYSLKIKTTIGQNYDF